MTKQPFRFALFLLICLSIPSTAAAQVKISAVPSVDNPAIGDTIAVSINISGASNVIGYEIALTFNPTQLEFLSIENSDYLPAGAHVTDPTVENNSVSLTAGVLGGETGGGEGTLAVATFKVLVDTETTVGLEDTILLTVVDSGFTTQPVELIGATINSTGSGEDVIVSEEVVTILDSNLRAAIEAQLGIASGDPILPSDMENLTKLVADNANISDLTGLEHATNLTTLSLADNNISDISPISGLTNLTTLWLHSNSILDISPVSGLTNLTTLLLPNNSILDISPVSGLTNLTWLGLGTNNVSDISPLVTNTGLGEGDRVDLADNPLNSASINTHIPVLEGRGVTVQLEIFEILLEEPVNIPDDNLRAAIEAQLGIASGDPILPSDMANLAELSAPNRNITDLTGLEWATNLTFLRLGGDVVEHEWRNSNSVSDLSVIAGLTNLTYLSLDNNSITDISPLVANTGLGEGDFMCTS